ncbi:MAG: LemA family protein [Oscillospiraceae bacterium]|jgi:hypothetical protein|nr:LemA family protein [Oscillospiraceae bacterium]
MKFFGNSGAAVFLTALMVIFAMLFGVSSSLGGMRNEAENLFYDGMGIEYDLERIIANSHNLLTVAKRYIGEDEQVMRDVADAREALSTAVSPAKKYEAELLLAQSASSLADALEEKRISDKDLTYVKECRINITSHEMTIASNGYNHAARSFNAELGSFPANILGFFAGLRPLELYG